MERIESRGSLELVKNSAGDLVVQLGADFADVWERKASRVILARVRKWFKLGNGIQLNGSQAVTVVDWHNKHAGGIAERVSA